MAIAFVKAWAQWQGASPASSASTTPGAAGNTLVVFGQNEAGTGRAVTPSAAAGSQVSPPGAVNDASGDTHAICANTSLTGSAQVATLTGTAGGDTMEGEGVEYSGVTSVSDGAANNRVAPGTGAGAIAGSAVTVASGDVLIAVCKCVTALIGDVIVPAGGGTNRDHAGGGSLVSYCVGEWAGSGGSITPTFTDATNGGSQSYEVLQLVLNAGAASLALTDLDTDEIVLDGQTGATISGTLLGASTAARVLTFEQGALSITQTQTAGNATSGTFDVVTTSGGVSLKYGSITAKVTIVADSSTATIAGTLNPPTGQIYQDIGTPDTTASNRITASGDLASGDQIHVRGTDGGAAPAGLTLGTDGTFYFLGGYRETSFDVRVWDASDQTWGAWATQVVMDISTARMKPSQALGDGIEPSFKDELTVKRWFD
jgi:hypothetical protein